MPPTSGSAKLTGELAELRGMAFLQRKLTSGLSDNLLCKEFGVSADTFNRGMRLACKQELIDKFEDELFKNLVPQALATAKAAMVDGNATVALEILKGAGVLKKQAETQAPVTEGDDLEVYIRAKRSHQSITAIRSAAFPLPRHELPEPNGDATPDTEELRQADGVDRLPGIEEPPLHEPAIEGELVEP